MIFSKWTLKWQPTNPDARPTDEFKEFLVQEAISSGRSIASIARDNGINQNLLHNWKREQKAKQAPFC